MINPEQTQPPEGAEDLETSKAEEITEKSEKVEKVEDAAEISEKIQVEQENAREDFGELIDSVSERYADMAPDMKKAFIEHNGDILDSVIELGVKKGLSQKDIKLTEIAAIIHDMTKAEPNKHDIPNYTLANHGESAATEVDSVVTNQMLEKAGIDVSDPNAVQDAKNTISGAVREHMGPHPGFMDGILAMTNAAIEAKNKELIAAGKDPVPLIKHPQSEGSVSETMLAADMGSLASQAGREKVMAIRSNVPFFDQQDQSTVSLYKKYGIDLKQGEAALLSGFDSAADAHDMLPDTSDRERTMSLIDESKLKTYKFNNPTSKEKEQVTWQEATQKRVDFLPQWIVDEQAKIDSDEYSEDEIDAAKKRVARAANDLDRAKNELVQA